MWNFDMDKKDNSYEYLVKQFTEDTILKRELYWFREANRAIREMKLEGKAVVNKNRLHHMILNYFADIARLKEFHKIKKINIAKVYGYSAYWFLRTSPIQLTSDKVNNNQLFVNEKCISLVLWGIFMEEHKDSIRNEILSKYLNETYYFFKYRNYNPQSIELQLTSILVFSGKNPYGIDK